MGFIFLEETELTDQNEPEKDIESNGKPQHEEEPEEKPPEQEAYAQRRERERIEIGPLRERQVPRLEFRFAGSASGGPDWATRNKLNAHFIRAGGMVYYGVHTFHRFLPPKQYFDEHPEYYSLIGGERRKNAQLCLTNPEIVPIVAGNVKKVTPMMAS